MKRITSELATNAVGSRYDLVLIASRRARELRKGWAPLVPMEGTIESTALAEIEAGLVGREYLNKPAMVGRDERPSPGDGK